MWDAWGQERFQSLGLAYYRGVDAAIIVYDVTDEESFKDIQDWLKRLNEFSNCVSIAIVGNKIDLDSRKQVTFGQLCEFCNVLSNDRYYRINNTQTESKTYLLCYGYLRQYEKKHCTLIHTDIYDICVKFYFMVGITSTIHPFQVSAKSGVGINEMFEQLTKVKACIDYYDSTLHAEKPFVSALDIDVRNKSKIMQHFTAKDMIIFLFIVFAITITCSNFLLY